ncbi:hypothetical protein MNBD_GAMMA04-1255 [hydrothermal vent metagenome]|uniref:Uncharacterized protein n=1 Tax=hydrothermal vent metagenome TaxID=652676 RepID=A0A3B0WKQ0_9ZZZZ
MSNEKETEVVGTEDPSQRVVVTTKKELDNEAAGELFVNYILVGFCIFAASGIGWKLFGDTGLMLGAVIGFVFTLFFDFGRKVVSHIIIVTVVLSVLLGIYMFGAWVFS